MRWLILLIIFSVVIANSCFANKIDSLKTKADVTAFLIDNVDTSYRTRDVFYCCRTDSFYRVDINCDGLNDLLIDASDAMIIIDKGGGKYESHEIPANRYYKAVQLGNLTALIYNDGIDTIIYKYGKFFVYHANKHEHSINKLYYAEHGCYGGCPVFSIEIHQDGNAFFDGKAFNKENRKFIAKMNSSVMHVINDIINELDIETLSNRYHDNTVDAPVAVLEIWYDGEKYKEIHDLDIEASLRLSGVYQMFEELRDMDIWKPWGDVGLNDSVYSVFIRDFRGPFRGMYRYSKYTYIDTGKASNETEKSKTFLLFDTTAITTGSKTTKLVLSKEAFIQINIDNSFIFGTSDYGAGSILSIGVWKKQNDSTIALNWDPSRTIAAVRDSAFCKLYFPRGVTPEPIGIQGWRLENRSGNRKILQGMGAKKEDE